MLRGGEADPFLPLGSAALHQVVGPHNTISHSSMYLYPSSGLTFTTIQSKPCHAVRGREEAEGAAVMPMHPAELGATLIHATFLTLSDFPLLLSFSLVTIILFSPLVTAREQ